MNKIYNILRWIRKSVEVSPWLFFILLAVVFLSWVSNLLISNNINPFPNRPNVYAIIKYFSFGFLIISGVYAALGIIYSKIDKIDERAIKLEYSNIKDENSRLISELSLKDKDIRQNCRAILKKIFDEFQLDSSSRVTLFYCKESSRNPNIFHILERYSTGGRQDHFLPESQYMVSIGVIKYIWENGFHIDIGKCPQYPDSGKKLEKKRQEYIQYQLEKYQITEDMIKSMNMKSCDFIGKNLSSDTANIILLFESRKSNSLVHITEVKLKKFLDSTFIKEYLVSHIELLNWLLTKQNSQVSVRTSLSADEIRSELNGDRING